MMTRRAIIVGGSMAGLLLGNMLVRQGWEVRVLERAKEELKARGAGIVPQRTLLVALTKAGATIHSNIGIHIVKRVAFDLAGAPFASHSYEQRTMSWAALYKMLMDEFPKESFYAGKNVVRILSGDDLASVVLDDGTTLEGDLIVGADGMRSTVRNELLPEAEPRYAGYVAWRGMLNESDSDRYFVRDCFSSISFSFPAGEELIGYPVAGADGSVDVGRRRFNVMWYRPVAPGAELDDLMTGVDGRVYRAGISPTLIRSELIAAMKADAKRLLPPTFSDAISRMEGMFFQAIYDLESPTMGRGRVALIGDAAFVARPHCGAGVSKAAEDATALTNALATCANVSDAIAQFSNERIPAGREAVKWAAHLGSYFQMDTTGRRRADFDPDKPPITAEYIIQKTGVELAEVDGFD